MFDGNGNSSGPYCVIEGEDSQSLYAVYMKVNGCIELIICLFGCLANSLNIAVLSRKEMTSSTNSILTALAVADLLVLLITIPLLSLKHLNSWSGYGRAFFVHFYNLFCEIFHTISIWLTVIMAVLRYIAIKFPLKNKTFCNKRNTNIAIALVYTVYPVLCLPLYFAMYIQEVYPEYEQNDVNMTMNMSYQINTSEAHEPTYVARYNQNKISLSAILWLYSVFFKLIPCIVLPIFTVCLILTMKSSDKIRRKLLNISAITKNEARLNGDGGGHRTGCPTDRTTRMLIALLGLFLATEMPNVILGLLTALSPHLFGLCFFAFGEMLDLMALIGSAVNFVVYCSMSKQFRSTFIRLARKALLPTRIQVVDPSRTCDSRTETTTVTYL